VSIFGCGSLRIGRYLQTAVFRYKCITYVGRLQVATTRKLIIPQRMRHC